MNTTLIVACATVILLTLLFILNNTNDANKHPRKHKFNNFVEKLLTLNNNTYEKKEYAHLLHQLNILLCNKTPSDNIKQKILSFDLSAKYTKEQKIKCLLSQFYRSERLCTYIQNITKPECNGFRNISNPNENQRISLLFVMQLIDWKFEPDKNKYKNIFDDFFKEYTVEQINYKNKQNNSHHQEKKIYYNPEKTKELQITHDEMCLLRKTKQYQQWEKLCKMNIKTPEIFACKSFFCNFTTETTKTEQKKIKLLLLYYLSCNIIQEDILYLYKYVPNNELAKFIENTKLMYAYATMEELQNILLSKLQ